MRVDETVPEVAVDVPCSLPTVLHGAGQRAEQLLNTLQKFNASERVEHYKLNAAGVPGPADVRSFDYIVSVSHDAQGGFQMQEYRNGGIVHSRTVPVGNSHCKFVRARFDFSSACLRLDSISPAKVSANGKATQPGWSNSKRKRTISILFVLTSSMASAIRSN